MSWVLSRGASERCYCSVRTICFHGENKKKYASYHQMLLLDDWYYCGRETRINPDFRIENFHLKHEIYFYTCSQDHPLMSKVVV